MATYTPPTEILPIFDSSVYQIDTEPLTVGEAKKKFVQYPTAQGITTFPSGITTQLITAPNVNNAITIGGSSAYGGIRTSVVGPINDTDNMSFGSITTGSSSIRNIKSQGVQAISTNSTLDLFTNIGTSATLNVGNLTNVDSVTTLININNNTSFNGNVNVVKDISVDGYVDSGTALRSQSVQCITASDNISLFESSKDGFDPTGSINLGATTSSGLYLVPPVFFSSDLKINNIKAVTDTDPVYLWERSGIITLGNGADASTSYVLMAKPLRVNYPIVYNGSTVPIAGSSPASTQLGGWFSGTRTSVSLVANSNNSIFTLTGGSGNGFNICNVTVTISGTPTIVSPTNFVVWVTKTVSGAYTTAQSGGVVSIPIFSSAIPTLPYVVSFSTYLDQTATSYCYIRLDCSSVTGLNYAGTFQKIRLA